MPLQQEIFNKINTIMQYSNEEVPIANNQIKLSNHPPSIMIYATFYSVNYFHLYICLREPGTVYKSLLQLNLFVQ